jgi:Terminase large subunit gpA, endonuclease domain
MPPRMCTPGCGSTRRRAGARVGAAARQPRTAVAVKGRDQDTALLLSVSKADAGGKRRGLRVWSVGTPVAKGELYRWLKLEWPTEEALEEGASYPPGACHFPQYDEEFFKQLTAERLVTRIVKGFPRGSWEKEPGRRNEALDAGSIPGQRRRSMGSTGSRSAIGGGWRKHWRAPWSGMIPSQHRRGANRASAGAAGDPQRLHGEVSAS